MRVHKELFTVLIVGGSVSGLVLANALTQRKIEWVILEAKDDLLANAGATLLIAPNGARILDQLGLLEEVKGEAAPILEHRTWLESGRLLNTVDMTKLPSRSGYDFLVIERQALLRVLLRRLPAKNIRLGKKAANIYIDAEEVIVTSWSRRYPGHIVVGADGVHSVTHGLMCSEMPKPSIFRPRFPDFRPTVDYTGIFGTSTPVAGLKQGIAHRTYCRGFSFIVTVGKDNKVHWYLAIRSRSGHGPIPRYDQKEIDVCVKPYLSVKVADGVCFEQVYRNRIRCCHVPLEEGLRARWAFTRVACIGDAVHKMTPNIAQGANCAIETAASLANHLSRIHRGDKNYPENPHLESWSRRRWLKALLFYWASHMLVRVEASSTAISKWIGWYIGYFHGELVMDTIAGISTFSEGIEFLPMPEHAGFATSRFGVVLRVVLLLCYGMIYAALRLVWLI